MPSNDDKNHEERVRGTKRHYSPPPVYAARARGGSPERRGRRTAEPTRHPSPMQHQQQYTPVRGAPANRLPPRQPVPQPRIDVLRLVDGDVRPVELPFYDTHTVSSFQWAYLMKLIMAWRFRNCSRSRT